MSNHAPRVCIITPRYPPDRCGVGDYTERLAQALVQEGIDVTVVTSHASGTRRSSGWHNGTRVASVIDDWGWPALARLVTLIRHGRFSVVHVQYQNTMYNRAASIAALPAALRVFCPWVRTIVTVHDYGTPWPRRLRVRLLAGPYGKAWFALMLATAWRVIVTNEHDLHHFTQLRMRYPIPASRYLTIPLASNLPAAELARPGEMVGELKVGYFGFVNAPKGVDVLIEAVRRARLKGCSLHLLLICAIDEHDPYQARIGRALMDPALRDAVTVTGEREATEVAALLASCAMVALPFREGISLRRTTLVAALTLGCAVISTRAAVPPVVLRDGQEVLLVPPDDAAALAEALCRLAQDRALRASLGAAAAAAAAQFTWPRIAAQTAALYRDAAR